MKLSTKGTATTLWKATTRVGLNYQEETLLFYWLSFTKPGRLFVSHWLTIPSYIFANNFWFFKGLGWITGGRELEVYLVYARLNANCEKEKRRRSKGATDHSFMIYLFSTLDFIASLWTKIILSAFLKIYSARNKIFLASLMGKSEICFP